MYKLHSIFNKNKINFKKLIKDTLNFKIKTIFSNFIPSAEYQKIYVGYSGKLYYNRIWLLHSIKNNRLCLNLKIVKKNYLNSSQFKKEFLFIYHEIFY